jgi:hypothetical protein
MAWQADGPAAFAVACSVTGFPGWLLLTGGAGVLLRVDARHTTGV